MIRKLSFVLVATALLAVVNLDAQKPDPAAVMLEAARQKEIVEGDLNAAIKQYLAIASTYGKANRPAAAQALLRLAECYQKLGNNEASNTYERIIRDFSDQADAVAAARTRLSTATVATGRPVRGDRAVWTGRGVDLFGTVSPDGGLLTYTDWNLTANVMVRDLAAGTSRPLTANTSFGEFGYADWSAISRDGDQVAYGWALPNDGPHELRIAPLRDRGVPTPRTLRRSDGEDNIRPFDWAPDGRSIAVLVEREDRSSQIGIVSVPDGALRVLKSVDWRGVGKMVFSPDGRHVAYDLSPSDARNRSDVFVMATDASRETPVVSDSSRNYLMGWSPTGDLLFASNRSGSMALWTVGVEEGRAQTAPTLVRQNIGSSMSLGLTHSGALYIWKRSGATYVAVAPIDLAAGKLAPTASTFHRFIDSRGRPSWSAGGKHLLYVSCGREGGGPCELSVLSTEAGLVHQVPHGLDYLQFPKLSPDGRTVVTGGTDLKGRRGTYVIDVETGNTSLALPPNHDARSPVWTNDGRGIRYETNSEGHAVIVERTIASGAETVLFRAMLPGAGVLRASPDNHLVGFVRRDSVGGGSALVVMPIAGGPAQSLLSVAGPDQVNWNWRWTPDSRAIITLTGKPGSPGTLWMVPLSGQPRKLDIDMSRWVEGGHLDIHPDGRQAAFVATAGEPGAEVWALENLPVTK